MTRFMPRAAMMVAATMIASIFLVLSLCGAPCMFAFADESLPQVNVSSEVDSATVSGHEYALGEFSRAQKGTNSTIENEDGTESYFGYRYFVSKTEGSVAAVAMSGYVVVYVPAAAAGEQGWTLGNADDESAIKALLIGLDEQAAAGGAVFDADATWHFTSEKEYVVGDIAFKFDQEVKEGQFYTCVIGVDGSDITDDSNPAYDKPNHADSARLVASSEVNIVQEAEGIAAIGEFLTTLDWSPLWITLKTTGVAILFIFVLGLAAAYFTLHINPSAQNFFDSVFTIPMVLPPTVCGFVLLYLCGSKTPFGEFFIDIGFPLIFSWPATVIAAVVVAFPLMYRNARGAFENLDPNMLDAARTLGWSNGRIFFKLMLPLSWSSIAAATVLAFARALGEFGATLFLAGNYIGITRTIPIAIYFEWMNGNDAVAWFWVAIIIVFSFLVILFINLWSNHTTKYRKRETE